MPKKYVIPTAAAALVPVSLVLGLMINMKNAEIEDLTKVGSSTVELLEKTERGDPLKVKINRKVLVVDPSRTIHVFGEITGDTTDDGRTSPGPVIADKIRALDDSGKSPIYLVINSPGGSVLGGAQIITAMQDVKSPVYAICIQLCASMAFMIHQYAKERYMTDRAILMSHQASMGVQGEFEQIRSRFNMLLDYVAKLEVPIAKRAGLTIQEYRRLIDNELWIDSDNATVKKFNDAVVVMRSSGGRSFSIKPEKPTLWPFSNDDKEKNVNDLDFTLKSKHFDPQFILEK
jgi:ATP-dependent protease ClpP protease subunit